jgi:hypothetical protein
MDNTPSDQEQPKDYATRRIDLDEPQAANVGSAPETGKKARARKTPIRSAGLAEPLSAATVPLDDQPLPSSPPPTPAPSVTTRNERVWIIAIISICIVVLACICACTIISAVFLNNAPW